MALYSNKCFNGINPGPKQSDHSVGKTMLERVSPWDDIEKPSQPSAPAGMFLPSNHLGYCEWNHLNVSAPVAVWLEPLKRALDFLGGPVAKISTSQCMDPGSIPGQGPWSHMLQLRVHMSQLKILHATTTILHSQINNLKKRERESPKQDQHRDYQLNPR